MLRIKQIGTICFAIFSFVFPSFATEPDIDTATASCNDDVFNSNSGPVDIEVNWEPNEINLRWYNNNTLMENVAVESANCTYDGILAPPSTIPQREGYTFIGWRSRPQIQFNKNVLGLGGDGISYYAKALWGGKFLCYNGQDLDCSEDWHFDELQKNEWSVIFDNDGKTLYGMATCTNQVGTFLQPGDPGDETGGYCWCKATGYKSTEQDTIYKPINEMPWVYRNTLPNNCQRNCPTHCAYATERWPELRTAILTSVGN